MPLGSTPTRASDDLGAALSDTRDPVEGELSAVNVERIKDRIIDLWGGVQDVEESINTALDPIWEWNGTDTSQFNAQVTVNRASNTDKAGAGSISAVADPINASEKVLRLTATALVGGFIFPINDLPTLPRKIRVEWCWCDTNSQAPHEGWIAVAITSAGNGLCVGRPFSSGAASISIMRIEGGATTGATNGTAIVNTAPAASQLETRRRYPASAIVMRPQGTPAHWAIAARAEGGAEGGRTSQEIAPAGSWDGLTFGTLGVGLYRGSVTPSDLGAHDLKYLRIYDAT